ncbi:MAG: glycosyltransferase family 2 protein [bacterium]|nr:glycosyltransferase family 2 protein [bacterium]
MEHYLLITPACNEEKYLEQTIKSVLDQTVLPVKYIIAVNNSNDRTEEIAREFSDEHLFIDCLRIDPPGDRNFGIKASVFNHVYEKYSHLDFQYVGNLDADITFEREYFSGLLKIMENNIRLGLTGGWIMEEYKGEMTDRFGNYSDHVPGAVQFFRKECFEEIGGYFINRRGAVDVIAQIMATMKGWTIEAQRDLKVIHHRHTGTEGKSIISSRYYQGNLEYSLGTHPVYAVAKLFYRLKEHPLIIGSFTRFTGYIIALIMREKREVPDEIVSFLRSEQLKRIKSYFSND